MFRLLCFVCLLATFGAGAAAIKPGQKVDLVVVNKSDAQMQVFYRGELIKSYRIAMGDNPKGHKLKEGDQRTPQGRYILDFKKADSAYYRSIHISYPNEEDLLRASALGISPGGAIMIHGQDPKSPLSAEEAQKYNWTNGCIAVTNKEMDELWQLIDPGTPIEIWP
ncbi:L,D-transpeptidase family protein [Shewanella sp. 3B26]|jgi:murein L,D-transpeptidase YafK|uniref:L,D-transpeptidase family protein n=1 Tax=Shewanella zhuhaiensis TaxID=2919576 RepID=A0AAJ1BG63_9GAMM|nr:L,D-transpeptidase family protein [Shewanella zhuhaiensis]MCH4294043.1 L,D-transpeptidase family protein [Shewanella zhuhaiensis]